MSLTSGARSWLERDHPVWVCLLPALALLPWLDKAFHIDDTLFLLYARLISGHPFDPFVQHFEWDSMQISIIDFPHPLLWQYLLAGVRAVFGESEVAMHLLTFAFGLLALAGLRGLAVRLRVPPLAACVLMAGSCGFLVMGSTIMPDLAAMALSVAALDRLVPAVEEQNGRDAWLSGALGGFAFLTRFTALFAVGSLLLYPLMRRDWRVRSYVPVAVALALVVASEAASFAIAGRPHFISSLFRWTTDSSWLRDIYFAFNELTFLGAQFPVTGLVLLAVAARGARSIAVVFVSGAVAVSVGVFGLGVGHGLTIAALLFAWPGLALVGDSALRLASGIADRFDAPDAGTALRWIFALTLIATTFATVRYEHVAVKYLLMPLPAAILLLLDGLNELRGRARSAGAIVLWLSCAVGGATGLGVALSDYRWANTYREFIDGEFRDRMPARGRTFYNAQWGLRYYAERAGLLPYRGDELASDDQLLMSTMVPPDWETDRLPRGVVRSWELSYPGPFAILSFEHRAGFYSNRWGVYAFAPSDRVSDTIFLLRTRAPATDAKPGKSFSRGP
ncbi:MAG: glycosyltransferase family 39 protein [Myxococcota bacterium]